ncbi:hypothetical protein [Marivivens aquimaris]|uniref:hypothetical protein n=1 Tax=Marivivens aquimaris TaxID=2774876 RepID=UPI00187ECBE0|nr:hypothetical protein [Marivivens aquimaris]
MSRKEAAEAAREIALKIEAGELTGFAYVAFGPNQTVWGWVNINDVQAHAAPTFLTRQLCKRDKADQVVEHDQSS